MNYTYAHRYVFFERSNNRHFIDYVFTLSGSAAGLSQSRVPSLETVFRQFRLCREVVGCPPRNLLARTSRVRVGTCGCISKEQLIPPPQEKNRPVRSSLQLSLCHSLVLSSSLIYVEFSAYRSFLRPSHY